MATITRRWYVYNGASGGQTNQANYFFVSNFPNSCAVTATNICAVLGVYEISGSGDDDQIFGTNPQSFAQDTALFNYITAATGNTTYVPSGPGEKPYVYKRDIL